MSTLVKLFSSPLSTLGALESNSTGSMFVPGINKPLTNTSTTAFSYSYLQPLSEVARMNINKIDSYKNLPANWNSYGAEPPSEIAIRNSIDFLARLSRMDSNPTMIMPSPDEGIVIEFQEGEARLEFLFLPDGTSEVAGFVENEMKFDHELSEATEVPCFKWLICPDGNCPDWR